MAAIGTSSACVGSSYMVTVWTPKGMWGLRQFHWWSRTRPGDESRTARSSLEEYLVQLAGAETFEGPVKKFYLGCGYSRRHQYHQWGSSTKGTGWWPRHHINSGYTMPQFARWAPSDIILVAAKKARSWQQLECVALAAINLCALPRLGEAITTRNSDKGELVFEGNKNRPGTHTYEVGPWPRRWLEFVLKIRTHKGYAQERPAAFKTADDLQVCWKSLL